MASFRKVEKTESRGRRAGAKPSAVAFGDIAGAGERARIKKIAANRGDTLENFVKKTILGFGSKKRRK